MLWDSHPEVTEFAHFGDEIFGDQLIVSVNAFGLRRNFGVRELADGVSDLLGKFIEGSEVATAGIDDVSTYGAINRFVTEAAQPCASLRGEDFFQLSFIDAQVIDDGGQSDAQVFNEIGNRGSVHGLENLR